MKVVVFHFEALCRGVEVVIQRSVRVVINHDDASVVTSSEGIVPWLAPSLVTSAVNGQPFLAFNSLSIDNKR